MPGVAISNSSISQQNAEGGITEGQATIIGSAIGAGTDLAKWGVDTILKAAKVEVAQLSSVAMMDANEMKKEYGSGISTEVIIENASDYTLTLQKRKDYSGRTGKYPVPQVIGPGQTGVFLHVHRDGTMCGSEAALVYRVGDSCDVFWGWDTPYIGSNKCYTEIREKDHWPNVGSWDFMQNLMEKNEHSFGTWSDFSSFISVGQSSSPVCVIKFERAQLGGSFKRLMGTPYSLPVQYAPGKTLHLAGTVHKGAKKFEVNMVTKNNDIAMHLSACFDEVSEDNKKIVRRSRQNEEWSPKEMKMDSEFSLHPGDNIDMLILCGNEFCSCEINSRMFFTFAHQVPLSEVKEATIIGDIDLHAVDWRE